MSSLLKAFTLVILSALLAVSLFRVWADRRASGIPSELPIYGNVGGFSLTEKNGEGLEAADLRGKVWIADFVFTRCAGPCVSMTRSMKKLQGEIGHPGVRFVSFSVDPEYDTPEVLANYAAKFGADPERWFFLTGDKQAIYELSSKKFMLGVTDAMEGETDPGMRIGHSTRFVLVDREGLIRGYYDGQEEAALERLSKDALRLAKTTSAGPALLQE